MAMAPTPSKSENRLARWESWKIGVWIFGSGRLWRWRRIFRAQCARDRRSAGFQFLARSSRAAPLFLPSVVSGQLGKDAKILVWNSKPDDQGRLQQLCVIHGDHKRAIIGLSCSRDGKFIASMVYDNNRARAIYLASPSAHRVPRRGQDCLRWSISDARMPAYRLGGAAARAPCERRSVGELVAFRADQTLILGTTLGFGPGEHSNLAPHELPSHPYTPNLRLSSMQYVHTFTRCDGRWTCPCGCS